MANIRLHIKDAVHFVTNRCEKEQFLMLPSKRVNDIILGWLAKALAKYGKGIELYAFVFLSNHFHMLLRDTKGSLAKFMCYFQGNIAKAINKERKLRGKFFYREYDDVIVDGENEFLDRYAYVVCNAVKSGLVDRTRDWPGVSSLELALSPKPVRVSILNRTKLHNATRLGQKVDVSRFLETFELSVATPPMLEGNRHFEIRDFILQLVQSGEAGYRELRGNKPALGVRKLLSQHFLDRPESPALRPRFKFFCHDPERKNELLEAYKAVLGAYRETWCAFVKAASLRKRPTVEWPSWTYPPSCWTPIGFAA